MLGETFGNTKVVRKRLPVFGQVAPIAKLSITSSKNVFIAKKFKPQGVLERTPISDSVSVSSDSASSPAVSLNATTRFSDAQGTFSCGQNSSPVGTQGAVMNNKSQSFSRCTSFVTPAETQLGSQNVYSGFKN